MTNQKYFVESGNWKVAILLSKSEITALPNPRAAYVEAATKAIEYLYDQISPINQDCFTLVTPRGQDAPITTGIFTEIYKPNDILDDHVFIRSSILFANAGLYHASTELSIAESNWTND
jgi:hypothetical protein